MPEFKKNTNPVMKKESFQLRSGNKPSFFQMGSSPMRNEKDSEGKEYKGSKEKINNNTAPEPNQPRVTNIEEPKKPMPVEKKVKIINGTSIFGHSPKELLKKVVKKAIFGM